MSLAGAAYGVTARALIATTPVAIQPMFWYGLRTSVGAITLLLPALSTLSAADWIWLVDVDYAANTNNVTIQAAGSDQIALWDASASSQTIDIAGTRVQLIVNAASWRMIVG